MAKNNLGKIKKAIEEEFQINTGNPFIPIAYTKESNGNIDFGSYGRRWCIRVVIDASKEDAFLDLLCRFCEERGVAFNEKGKDPFEGRHPLFS